jgi:hypothetical protein
MVVLVVLVVVVMEYPDSEELVIEKLEHQHQHQLKEIPEALVVYMVAVVVVVLLLLDLTAHQVMVEMVETGLRTPMHLDHQILSIMQVVVVVQILVIQRSQLVDWVVVEMARKDHLIVVPDLLIQELMLPEVVVVEIMDTIQVT